ncbi:MAG: ral secretion pathway protein [Bacillota bacterium]|jgi:type II secretion system protein G|nr:ral secretion pathway protein [Bacillota bacterium]MDK2925701.1 ral secretion pathway protein [Bacillota bacterium]
MRRLLKNQGGFTLIELLIVVLIIGVLAGIAVPKVAGYSDAAKKRACQANMKQIATALEAYYIDHGRYPDDDDELKNALEGTYLKAFPKCPGNDKDNKGSTDYEYTQEGTSGFKLVCPNHEFEITEDSEDFKGVNGQQ